VSRNPPAAKTHQTYRVNFRNGMTINIGIRIDSTVERDWIALRIPANRRVIVAHPVLMQSCVSVEDLSREAQRL
jgi:hypothetical protein